MVVVLLNAIIRLLLAAATDASMLPGESSLSNQTLTMSRNSHVSLEQAPAEELPKAEATTFVAGRRVEARLDEEVTKMPFAHLAAKGHKVGDPRSRRSVGTQSEVPRLVVAADNSSVSVSGYQKYTIHSNGVITGSSTTGKYAYAAELLLRFQRQDGASTFADIGCNAGIMSLLARRAGYDRIFSLDHDSEYIALLQHVVQTVHVKERGVISASTFDFGDPLPAVDVILCGAIIHWVYCRTANFANRMDLIFQYLFASVNKFLIFEWVDPADVTVRHFKPRSNPDSCRANISHPTMGYNQEAFEHAARQHGDVIETFFVHRTRKLFVFKKREVLKRKGYTPSRLQETPANLASSDTSDVGHRRDTISPNKQMPCSMLSCLSKSHRCVLNVSYGCTTGAIAVGRNGELTWENATIWTSKSSGIFLCGHSYVLCGKSGEERQCPCNATSSAISNSQIARLQQSHRPPIAMESVDHELDCTASGELQQAYYMAKLTKFWNKMRNRSLITVRLANGSKAEFRRSSHEGVTSAVFIDAPGRRVLKISPFSGGRPLPAARREMCMYRLMQRWGFSWTPQMLCTDNHVALITTHAGERVTSANIPPDYAVQFAQMLSDMAAHEMKHNDLKHSATKRHGTAPPKFRRDSSYWHYPDMELFVRDRRLMMIDFNMATLGGSYSCADGYVNTSAEPRYHTPSDDRLAIFALDQLNRLSNGKPMAREVGSALRSRSLVVKMAGGKPL